MKISLQQFSVICLILITFAGCKKGTSTAPPVVIPDTTKPTLSIVKPTAAQQFAAGANIPFQVTLTDNEKLKSYDIAVSLKLAGGLILKIVPTSTPFSYTKSATTLGGGKTQDVTVTDINIPAKTAPEFRVKNHISRAREFFAGLLSERFVRRQQMNIMPTDVKDRAALGDTTVVLSDTTIKLHQNDRRAELRDIVFK